MVPCMHVHSWPLSTEMWEGEVLAVNLYTLIVVTHCKEKNDMHSIVIFIFFMYRARSPRCSVRTPSRPWRT